MQNDLRAQAERLAPELTAWRRALHRIPETGTALPQTMRYLKTELEKLDIPHRCYEDISCISATIGEGERCFLLRADVDGLPLREQAQVDFRATNGNMHACGHDLHGAMLLGAAKLLKAHEKALPGRVKLLFQSGEETFQGAKASLEAGILRDTQAALALHVIAMLPCGTVLTGKAPMASVDVFRITLTGRGGHGSMPEAAIDPINAAVQVYLAFQALIAREVGGTQEAVLTIGRFCAGDAANAIPEQAVLEGTLRTFDPDLRRALLARAEETALAVANAYRCQCLFEKTAACAAVVTDDAVTATAKHALAAVAPEMHWTHGAHGMGSEDFAQIAEQIPAAYLMLGAAPTDAHKRYPQHNPKIEFNEAVLPIGAALYAQTALDWLSTDAARGTAQ